MHINLTLKKIVLTSGLILLGVFSFGQTITKEFVNVPLVNVLKEVEKQTGMSVIYETSEVNETYLVTARFDNASVEEVLQTVLEGSLYYSIEGKIIVLHKQPSDKDKPVSLVQQQHEHRVTGTVVDESGLPIIGASIVAQGSQTMAISDMDGNFSIRIPADGVLIASYIGFITRIVSVNNQTGIRIVMSEDRLVLEEVVVVGYGTQKKKLLTGANLNIKEEDITKRSTQNALDALIGQSPGVQIIASSGQPGEDFRVSVRGLGTVGDATPLYVVDGVQVRSISHINPSEIESIDVLKDAASAAIYGARAANGVLLVTTKKGKTGKTVVGYEGFMGFQSLVRMPEMLNAQDYMMIMDEASINSGGTAYGWLSEFKIDPVKIGQGTDWLNQIVVKNAKTQNHVVSVSGGSQLSVFALSLSYSGQEGVIGGKDYSNNERFNFRINSDHKIFRDIVKIGENISLSYINRNGVLIGNQFYNVINDALRATPVLTPYNEEGTNYASATLWYVDEVNPLASLVMRNQNKTQTARLSGDIYLEVQPIKNLKLRSVFALDYNNSNNRSYTPQYYYGSGFYNDTDYVIQQNALRTSWSWENTLNYNFNLKNHNFDILLGIQARQETGQYLSAQKYDLIFNDFDHAWIRNATNSNANMVIVDGYPYNLENLVSYFGRISYNYKEKYMFTATVRADGSSKFGPANRFGVFPSVSAGWVISSEGFMESLKDVISFLKLRASWGQNGNNRIADYTYLSTIATTSYAFGDKDNQTSTTTGVYENSMPNVNVKWETSEQLDLGLDMQLLNGKIQAAFDYYNKTTRDWLLQADVLDVFGAQQNPYINGGSVRNKGVEFGVSYFGQVGNELRFSIGANGAFNKNEVISVPNVEGIIHGSQDILFKGMQEMNRAQEGYPIGYFWGLNMLGIFQNQSQIDNHKNSEGKVIQPYAKPGDIIYDDTNEDGKITQADNIFLGQPYPTTTVGLNLSLNYKGFDFYLVGNGSFGMQIAKCYRPVDRKQYNYTTDILGRWTGEGTSNTIPRVTNGDEDNGNRLYMSQLYIEDADFFRISNVTLGYNFARLFKQKTVISQLRAYVSVQNALVITRYSGMDPEVGYSGGSTWGSGIDLGFYPRARTVLFGLSIKL
ncbi:MAG: TonB-dependent receptor [Bacteroidales bacterium]|jgi:TonB-linked SusC/RagA family outer membrane protein|nr:TonB-dependent receptor [Bacteroidales bacterium]